MSRDSLKTETTSLDAKHKFLPEDLEMQRLQNKQTHTHTHTCMQSAYILTVCVDVKLLYVLLSVKY